MFDEITVKKNVSDATLAENAYSMAREKKY